MDLKAFRSDLRAKRIRRAYLFTGEEELLKGEALEELRRAAGGERAIVRKFSGFEARARDVVEAAANLSLLDPVAVVLVRQAARLAKAETEAIAAEWKRLAGAPPLVFWDTSLDKRWKLFSEIARDGGEVDFRPLRTSDARTWVEEEARRLGHRLGSGVADLLVDLVGTHLSRLRRTLEVLSLAVGAGRVIEEPAVAEMVSSARAHAFFELQDAVAEQDGARAIALFREAVGDGERPELLVGVLFAELRRLLVGRDVSSRRDYPAEITRTPSFKVDDVLRRARRFTAAGLRDALHRLADLDVAVKSGRGEPAALVEDWILGVCAVRDTIRPAGLEAALRSRPERSSSSSGSP